MTCINSFLLRLLKQQSQLSNLASPGILGGLEDPGKEVYTVALPSSPIVQETETSLSEHRKSCTYIYMYVYMYIQTTPPYGHSLPISVSLYPFSDSLSLSRSLFQVVWKQQAVPKEVHLDQGQLKHQILSRWRQDQQDHLDMVHYQLTTHKNWFS